VKQFLTTPGENDRAKSADEEKAASFETAFSCSESPGCRRRCTLAP
jgi:hypothetical protein